MAPTLDLKACVWQAGLLAEETKRPTPGAGLCPGYTISRAILADAVALTRGDRFLTADFTRTLLRVAHEDRLIYIFAHSVQSYCVGVSRLPV